MKKTGSLLKSKREAANLSLSEVALATKINPKVLTAIENGDEKNLPAKTFLKGFIKSYALFLKMDVEEVMNVFQEETGGARPATQHPVEQTRNESAQSSRRRVNDENSSGMRTVAVVVIVILIGMIIGVRELIEKYQREKVVESPVALKATPVEVKPEVKRVEAPTADENKTESDEDKTPETADVKPVEEPTKPVEVAKSAEPPKPVEGAKPAEPAKPAESAKPAEPVAETKYPEFKPEVKPINIPTAVFPNLVEIRASKPVETKPATEVAKPVEPAKPAETVKQAEAPKPAEPAKPAEPSASNKPDPSSAAVTPSSALKAVKNEIILEALDKVEVKFQVGGQLKRVSLAPQEVHTIRADKPLTLDLSDGGAVNIILNGKDRGPAGDLGKPATIKLP